MSNHQKGAGISEFVGPLLKRLKEQVPENSEMENIIEQISIEVVKTKDMLVTRENLDKKLVGCLQKIERQIDPWIVRKPCVKASDLPQKVTKIEMGQSSNQSHQMDGDSNFGEFRDSLVQSHRLFLDILALIPENATVKKRFLIYWWTADDCYNRNYYKRFINNLLDKKVLIPVRREHYEAIDYFTIEPIFHKWLISKREQNDEAIFEKREEGSWCFYMGILLNRDQRYLDSKDIIDTLNKCAKLEALQLGNWRYTTVVHNGVKEDHIEVNETDFLKKLGKDMRYLSLRGISGIVEIPESIGKLERLMILDLRACHNLEKLPQKPRHRLKPKGWWFVRLMVLDISECYLLDHMPKWICELYNLKVLKGFVVGNLGNKNQSCNLGDLSKLLNLRKLSIRFTSDILGPEVFNGFRSLHNLFRLTIIWKQNKEIPTYYLPTNIKKLDIRCYPEADVLSKLQNPGELINMNRLYIRGGNLTKIPCHHDWEVEVLRLRFLNKLVYPTDWEELRSSFKKLKYVEYVGCSKPKNFPNNGSSWHE